MSRAVRRSAAWLAAAMFAFAPVGLRAQSQGEQSAGDHDHAQHAGGHAEASAQNRVAAPTDEERAAAFAELQSHAIHDRQLNSFVLFDQLEWQPGTAPRATWDMNGWVGYDRSRVWMRSEGDAASGSVERGELQLLYGRALRRWWDVVAGARQDFAPGGSQTWAALGIQGLAPYWFEVEATAFVGAGGRTHLRLESEYELFVTNRLTLQPRLEAQIYGKEDPERGQGKGLSEAELGLRLRYIVRRELAPYVGVTWQRKFFDSAKMARAAGEASGGARAAIGLRLWF